MVTQSTTTTIIASDEHRSSRVAMLDCVTNPFQELLIVPAGHSLSAKGVVSQHRTKLCSTDLIERLKEEAKRRAALGRMIIPARSGPP